MAENRAIAGTKALEAGAQAENVDDAAVVRAMEPVVVGLLV